MLISVNINRSDKVS